MSYGYQVGTSPASAYPSGLKVFYRRTAGRITAIEVQEPAGRKQDTRRHSVHQRPHPHRAGPAQGLALGHRRYRQPNLRHRWPHDANEFASYIYDAAGQDHRHHAEPVGEGSHEWSTARPRPIELYQEPLTWTSRLRQPQPPDQLRATARKRATPTTRTATASPPSTRQQRHRPRRRIRPARLHSGDQPEPERGSDQQPAAGLHADVDQDAGGQPSARDHQRQL